MSLFAVVYSCRSLSCRSRQYINFKHSICHGIIPLFVVVHSLECHIEPLGSVGNRIGSDSDSDLVH